jgi:hypothetical protein
MRDDAVKPRSALKTSGRYLIEVLAENADQGPEQKKRYDLGFDVYIKHRSYAIMNKILFVSSVISCGCVTVWPILVQFPPVKQQLELVGVAVVQTMITGFAGFNVYAYHHYKVRQVATENILRAIAFSSTPLERLVGMVRDEMSRLDQGIGLRLKSDHWEEGK